MKKVHTNFTPLGNLFSNALMLCKLILVGAHAVRFTTRFAKFENLVNSRNL